MDYSQKTAFTQGRKAGPMTDKAESCRDACMGKTTHRGAKPSKTTPLVLVPMIAKRSG